MFNSLKQFDSFPKTLDDFKVKTLSGGTGTREWKWGMTDEIFEQVTAGNEGLKSMLLRRD
jgi:hypothetical protein